MQVNFIRASSCRMSGCVQVPRTPAMTRPAIAPTGARCVCAIKSSVSAGQRSTRCTRPRWSASAVARRGRRTSSVARSQLPHRSLRPRAGSACCTPRPHSVPSSRKFTGVTIRHIHGDKGYRGHNYPDRFKVWITGQVRRVTKTIPERKVGRVVKIAARVSRIVIRSELILEPLRDGELGVLRGIGIGAVHERVGRSFGVEGHDPLGDPLAGGVVSSGPHIASSWVQSSFVAVVRLSRTQIHQRRQRENVGTIGSRSASYQLVGATRTTSIFKVWAYHFRARLVTDKAKRLEGTSNNGVLAA
jgi:hypothetical protein